jgi:hypothetical protein
MWCNDILVTARDVHLRKIANARDLHVIRRLHKMHTLQGPIRNGASASARPGAPRHFNALGVPNGARRRRRPETEIVDITGSTLTQSKMRKRGNRT